MQVPIGIRRQGQELPDECLRFELSNKELSQAILLWLHKRSGLEVPENNCFARWKLILDDYGWTGGVIVHFWQPTPNDVP